jgi:hypothetical protein
VLFCARYYPRARDMDMNVSIHSLSITYMETEVKDTYLPSLVVHSYLQMKKP